MAMYSTSWVAEVLIGTVGTVMWTVHGNDAGKEDGWKE